jgi:5-methylcytosine-specific restriction protein A
MTEGINPQLPSFVIGLEYKRQSDIHARFGGSRQSGISASAICPAIFLFTGESGAQYGYEDGFDQTAEVFSYTGEGQLGDMIFKAGNKAIRDHSTDGRALHLFKATGKGRPCRYLGEFVLANYSMFRGPDRVGKDREIIVFHLVRADQQPSTTDSASSVAPAISISDARARALAACEGNQGDGGRTAIQTVYERSKAVRDYVLLRAGGRCEACESPAPFEGLDGLPYLEAHHTTRLSDGGPDHPRHVAALCPTCHRNIHYGRDGTTLNQSLTRKLLEIE